MGKRREREKNQNRFTQKKSKFWLMPKPQKEKKLLNYGNYIQLADVYVLSIGSLVFSHFHANWAKNSSKRSWSKMQFFPK